MPETQPSEGSEASKDSGYIQNDDTWSQWRNFFSMLSGKMPPEGQKQYWLERDKRNEAIDCARCEDQKQYLLKYSPIIRYLRTNINQLGADINEDNIYCRRCEKRQGGGFSPEYGIKICANEMTSKGVLEDTIAHEMVHAYDHLRFKLDWHDDLRHAACTEIRASSLSGECRWAREFFKRGQWKLTQQHQNCVWRRAVLSVKARPGCKDDVQAAKVVNEVWESCFKDTRPFDEIFR